MNGQQEEFEAALRKLRGKDADISYERSTIQVCLQLPCINLNFCYKDAKHDLVILQEYLDILETLPKATFINLFDTSNYRAVIVSLASPYTLQYSIIISSIHTNLLFFISLLQISVGLMAFQQFVGINGIIFYSTEIFKSAGNYYNNVNLSKVIFISGCTFNII